MIDGSKKNVWSLGSNKHVIKNLVNLNSTSKGKSKFNSLAIGKRMVEVSAGQEAVAFCVRGKEPLWITAIAE